MAYRPMLLLLGIGLAVAAWAAEPESAQSEVDRQFARQLARLVQQLNDDRAAKRDAAEAELLDLAGTTVAATDRFLALLPVENEQMPLAVRDRLARIRRQVESRIAKAAVEGTTVTLSARKMPVPEIFAAIEKQTGNRFVDNRDLPHGPDGPSDTISIDLKNEPFWSAVDRILDRAAAGTYPYGGEQAVLVVARSPTEAQRHGRAFYSGPFRIELVEVAAQRNLRSPPADSLKLHLEVAWEPRLRPIALSQPIANVVATTDGGEQLAAKQREAVLDVEVPGGTQAAEIILPFELPPRDVGRIAMLRGKLHALVPGRQVKFRFDELAKAKGRSEHRGGVQVAIDDIRKNNEIWEIHMRLTLDQDNEALQSHRGWAFQNLSYLVGRNGETIDNAGFETTRQTRNELGVAYLFELPEGIDGLSWVYETPAAIVELPIEYELKDISLP